MNDMTRTLRWWLALAGVLLAAVAGADRPGDSRLHQVVQFSIERGPLEHALIQFSRQAEVQVVLASNLAGDLVASEVRGSFSASSALTKLLKGTGLVYATVGNTVTVRLPEASKGEAVAPTRRDLKNMGRADE
ncbi:STN domain-containing protein [Steroidobacter sp.]|uniref:STN domain-containing protein n=1 Tax=Steroidobacter sp. TaxID=1978227 RepID=UPI001A5C8BFF|nr:STN domain-containing protein [Steroidobacter sp.]MBL8270062.1 STN domain-containing protein [Steroidobacter sp.]